MQPEHVCLRCPMLWPDPAQRARLVAIRDNVVARIAEAEREGWLGEVEGRWTGSVGWSPSRARPSPLSASMRAVVTIPRSPTITTSSSPERSRTPSAPEMKALGSAVLPAKTSTATGRPSGQQMRPYSTWAFAHLGVTGVAALGQWAVAALHPGTGPVIEHPAPGARCRRAKAASMSPWRALSQSMAA